VRRWRIRRNPSPDSLLDLTKPLFPGELDRPLVKVLRPETAEDEHNAADLDEIEAEEAAGANPWPAELERLARQPTVVVSVSGPGQSLDLTVSAPLAIVRQVVELALAEVELRT
jgi:hypothetical protein